jgi:hypothetical protein
MVKRKLLDADISLGLTLLSSTEVHFFSCYRCNTEKKGKQRATWNTRDGPKIVCFSCFEELSKKRRRWLKKQKRTEKYKKKHPDQEQDDEENNDGESKQKESTEQQENDENNTNESSATYRFEIFQPLQEIEDNLKELSKVAKEDFDSEEFTETVRRLTNFFCEATISTSFQFFDCLKSTVEISGIDRAFIPKDAIATESIEELLAEAQTQKEIFLPDQLSFIEKNLEEDSAPETETRGNYSQLVSPQETQRPQKDAFCDVG